MTEIDPTRLSVSDDGRTVCLDGEEFLTTWGGHIGSDANIATAIRNLPYRIYCEEALRAHGSDFSYLRLDSREPFVGRVMAYAEQSHTPVKVLARRNSAQWWGEWQDGSGSCDTFVEDELIPLPAVTRRPMRMQAIVELAGKHNYIALDGDGKLWRIEQASFFREQTVSFARDDFHLGRLSCMKTREQLADEGWKIGDQLLSVEE